MDQKTEIEPTKRPEERQAPGPSHLRGLSIKLLALTILFVMLGEVLIFVPSIAKFRIDWLQDRLSSARTASLVLEAAPDGMVPEPLRILLEGN